MELELIHQKIHTIRGLRVMLDFDLAILYTTENRVLKQAVKRNIERFPDDFIFQLSKTEWEELITNCDNLPKSAKFSPVTPLAFTEQGVAMLSSVLKNKTAIQINIVIMRAFVFVRQYALSNKDLYEKLAALEQKYDQQFDDIHEAINYLLKKDNLDKQQKNRPEIGYKK